MTWLPLGAALAAGVLIVLLQVQLLRRPADGLRQHRRLASTALFVWLLAMSLIAARFVLL